MRVAVVLPPWLPRRDEREALVRAAALLGCATETIDVTGRAAPAAVAAHVAKLLEPGGRRLVIFPAGSDGEEAAALLAARLGGSMLGRCSSLSLVDGQLTAARPAFGGRAELRLRCAAALACATLRLEPGDAAPPQAPVAARTLDLEEPPTLETEPVAADAVLPRVEGTPIVVCGGRGIGGPEGFALLARIASALGAGLGGSLPAVDAGWLPVAHQVGQSGKFISPKVYFAVGVSGTPQHLAGVSSAARIVALNSDRNAAIFAHCDVAVEGDWREILPRLAQELEASARGGTPPGS